MSDVKFTVTLDASTVEASMKNLDKALDDLGKTSGTAAGSARAFGNDLMGKLFPAFTAAQLAADGVKRDLRFLKDQFVDTMQAAIESEKVDRALESALMITGQAAGGTADKVKRYAAALQMKTVYDDEAIKSAQALIIQMRGTSAELEKATRGAIGLASVFGMDLDSAAKAVALGFEGNYRQLGQLIPAIRNATTEGQKHAAMMKSLADYYQRAEDETTTFGGKLTDLKDAYGELQETIGGFVTKNKDVIDTLSGVKEIIEWVDRWAQKTQSAGKDKSPLSNLLNWTGPGVLLLSLKGMGEAAKKANDAFDATWEGYTLGVMNAARRTALDAPIIKSLFIDTAKAAAEAEKDFVSFTRSVQVAHSALEALEPIPFKLFGDFEPEKDLYQLTALPKKVSDIAKLMGDPKNAPKLGTWKKSFAETAEDIKNTMDEISTYSSQVFGQLDTIFAQSQRNKEIAIENEYKTRLAVINKTIKDETKRQQAVMALEAEYEIKKTEAKRAAAKQSKAVAIMEATVNVAQGITSALAMFPPNFILAALVAAMGAVQIGTIAAQPIPLAKGGYFPRATLMPGRDGRTYLGGEEGPEIMSPVPVMRQIVREESRAAAPVYNIKVDVTLNAQTIDEDVIDSIAPRLFKAIEGQLRIGRRL